MNLHATLFYLVAGLTGLCAVATTVSHNIVRSATWLLFTLAGTSAIFFLLGADLVGAVQLLVYVGGTLVLVVFGVMLTAQGPFITMKTSGAEWAISVAAGGMLLAVLTLGATSMTLDDLGPPPELRETEALTRFGQKKIDDGDPEKSRHAATLGQGFSGVPVGPAHTSAGRVVRMNYLLPFELVSVHLLVVLIGAAYLARTKRRRGAAS